MATLGIVRALMESQTLYGTWESLVSSNQQLIELGNMVKEITAEGYEDPSIMALLDYIESNKESFIKDKSAFDAIFWLKIQDALKSRNWNQIILVVKLKTYIDENFPNIQLDAEAYYHYLKDLPSDSELLKEINGQVVSGDKKVEELSPNDVDAEHIKWESLLNKVPEDLYIYEIRDYFPNKAIWTVLNNRGYTKVIDVLYKMMHEEHIELFSSTRQLQFFNALNSYVKSGKLDGRYVRSISELNLSGKALKALSNVKLTDELAIVLAINNAGSKEEFIESVPGMGSALYDHLIETLKESGYDVLPFAEEG